MRLSAYSIFDDKVNAFSTPFFSSSIPAALRSFSDAVSDTQTLIHHHPQDFSLYRIGDFDTDSGLLTAYDKPVYLSRALDHINAAVSSVLNTAGRGQKSALPNSDAPEAPQAQQA